MIKLRGATQVAVCLSLLLGACSSGGTADGDIDLNHFANSDAPHRLMLHIQHDGMMHRTRSGGYDEVDEDVTLPADALEELYGQATDAHFEGLPAEILCNCADDHIGGDSYAFTVTVDGQPHKTVTYQVAVLPSALKSLADSLDCLSGQSGDADATFCTVRNEPLTGHQP